MNVEVLCGNLGRTEGPVFGSGGDVIVTSTDRGHLYSIARDGTPTLLTAAGGGVNGATEHPDGIYLAQNGGRSAVHRRPTLPGGVQVLRPHGRLDWLTYDPISPNDLCFGPNDMLFVTDPTRRPERDDGRIWVFDGDTGATLSMISVPWYPNGIGFGLDDDVVFVASTGQSRIVRYALDGGRLMGPGETFVDMPYGLPDGFAFDVEGNMVLAAVGVAGEPGEIQVWSPEGKLLDRVRPGPSSGYTNLALSAAGVLVVTDSDGHQVLIIEDWPAKGLPLHPYRNIQSAGA